ncbi:thiol reductant ABC exporter subunit CydC [Nocardia sp. NBC_00565]|uniref:thiol reductant ABC exporter subunit CydC n=1 Tax=Nocardia sp. NBC_00565 TaxID=2975993 RepID=UPI002E80B3A2|nr:thiol reductant ABC exporter subunit CydC [Nocardia sp. NBC_00565]WUC08241.1 thiol reductant ABC exporter subunit CydC [Nocardia sp. NBC_00565]
MWALLDLSLWRIAVAIAWGVLALGSGLGLAALAAWLIARAWQMPPVLDLSVAVVAVRALGISRGLCRYLERLATHDVALRAMTTARTTVYRTLARSDIWMRRAIRSADDPPSLRRGDLLVRIGSDIDDLGAVVVRVFVPIAVAIVLSVAAVGLLATISVGAAAILAVSLVVAGIVAPWLSGWAARAAERAVRADRAEFTAQALTVLDHAPELRVAGKLDAALAAAQRAGQRAVAAEDSAAARSAWAAAATPLSIGASVIGALLVGIAIYGPHGGAPGAMTPMALTVLVLLPLSAFEAVAPLPAAAQALTTARAALHRLSLLEGAGSALPTARDRTAQQPFNHAATGHSVNGRSRPPRDLLPDNLPARPEGRRIAVVGPSGAGKTTLLMAWAGLFDTPEPGVTFFAEDAHIFGTTVLENLRAARGDLTADEAEKALCAVGLREWVESLPDGVDTDLVGGAAAVSGGQRRRILLARALISPARVLLLDEPTEHLEAEAGAELLRDLLDSDSGLLEPDRIVVVVTHQLPSDHRADTVLHVNASGQVTTDFPAYIAFAAPADSADREIPLPTR